MIDWWLVLQYIAAGVAGGVIGIVLLFATLIVIMKLLRRLDL